MLYDALVAASRRNDSLDDVRSAALHRVRWLVDLLERQRAEFRRSMGHEYRRFRAAGAATQAEIEERLAACADEEGRAAVLCLMQAACFDDTSLWQYDAEIGPLISRVRGWMPDEVAVMLLRATEYDKGFGFANSLGLVLNAADRLDAAGRRAVMPWLRHAHTKLMDATVEARLRATLAQRLRALLASVDEAHIPEGLIPADAPWASPLRQRVKTSPTPELACFVRHLVSLSGPRPAQRWRRTCLELADAASARDLVADVLRALAGDDPLCSRGSGAHTGWLHDDYHYHYVVHQNDGDLARGAVWAAALTGGPAAVQHLGALALRTGGLGTGVIEDLKLAGAAINALAETGDAASLEALWRLQSRIKHRALRKQLDTALVTAAGKQGITAEQLIERSVPDHGLAPDGSLERELGGHRVRVAIEEAATVRLTFMRPDGGTSRTAPAAVKDRFLEELKEVKALAKEVRGTLSGERARVEALMSAGREWPYDEWCRYYRDHPVTGVLVRGLIWEFRDADGEWRAVAPMAEPSGRPERVRLWHPIRASTDDMRAWRERLVAERLRQPFKQAFREIYLLTPAEEETGVYSNRFAAHIVHYRQLYALFKERGWQANFLGRHDGGYDGKARAEFGDGEWRACFHHEPAADDDGSYAPEHAATDQVRFERRDGRRWREVPLAEVPPLVFSEAMRDVDLFVGVTSIAVDPDWADRGEDRYAVYWRTATFGALTASAEIRREALERILPRLKIAGRCTLDGRFLIVRGDLGTYKIHLGSANILMEPDNAYLCIVPSRGKGDAKVFLPFEDERLSLILSKAFLLAADTKITDESILIQIKRGA
ncbi:DUF4132 domain-containing protein [Streptomyces sp. NBC_01242]|uniref:DUF4132 domain-containing protein n=1 Tax=unclassified Streptomyces TaxID=2593676 RepID=UPI00225B3999|nr:MULTISPECIES: DUF4132 domain-containing protein [unclassified Streptomyces]MCX4794897.1 DUF4132 domain-containing protein [Streptomyces sp. NBC_01242]WSJ36204.1 DUF4132 domain-containing protein [Streptomyces sp. NBC_01321]